MIKKIFLVIFTLTLLQVIQAQFDCQCSCCFGEVDCEPALLGNFEIAECTACVDTCRENFEECPNEGETGNMVASCENSPGEEEPEPEPEPEPVEGEEPEPEPEPVEGEEPEPEPEPVEGEEPEPEPEPVEDEEPEPTSENPPVSAEPVAGSDDEVVLLVTVFGDAGCTDTIQKFVVPSDNSCTRIEYDDGTSHYVRGTCLSETPSFEYCGTASCDDGSCTPVAIGGETCSAGFDIFPHAVYDCAPLVAEPSSALKHTLSLITLIVISLLVLS